MTFFPDLLRAQLCSAQDKAGGGAGGVRTLDFENPADNLYAFGKLWATYADAPVFSAFHGLMFGQVGNRRLEPLFGYAGFGGFQAKVLENGNVRLRGKETGYFTDLSSGEVLDCWDNPYTGERVKVFNFLNDRIRGELTPVMPEFQFGDGEDAPTAALREVEEETGVAKLVLGKQLMTTYHTYRNRKGKRVLKPTYWFEMSTSQEELIPEAAEGIDRAEWKEIGSLFNEGTPLYQSLRYLLCE